VIEKQTVLILGAGGSMPYGFPSGSGLRRAIIEQLDKERITSGGNTPLSGALRDTGFPPSELFEFRDELLEADTTSIDVFLERRAEFLDVGKAAIAATLIPLESTRNLFQTWTLPTVLANQTWYQYFASTLRMTYSNWGVHRLTIITYNYDRSLDHYLFTILRGSCKKSVEECWQKFREIRIIHLYGELGVYHPLATDSLPYNSPLSPETVTRAATGIRIVSEDQDSKRFSEANDAISAAERIYILGLGYAPESMGRLNIRQKSPGYACIRDCLSSYKRRTASLETWSVPR